MRKVRQRPARTLPVAVLDLLLGAAKTVRELIRRAARLLPGRRGDRVLAAAIVVAALVAVIGTGFLAGALLRTPDQLAPLGVAPTPTPAAEPTAAAEGEPDDLTGTPPPPPSAPLAVPPPRPRGEPPRRTPEGHAPRTPGAPPILAARYATEEVTLLNYTASVAITNPGSDPVDGWTLTITLPRSTQAVGEVTGARVSRDGNTWAFVPDQATRRVPAGGSVEVRFRIDGSLFDSAPTSCLINNRTCVMEPTDR